MDEILEKGDKDTFDAISKAINQISENPEIGKPLFIPVEEVIKELESYKGGLISSFSKWNYFDSDKGSIIGEGEDFCFTVSGEKNIEVEVFNSFIYKKRKKVDLLELVKYQKLLLDKLKEEDSIIQRNKVLLFIEISFKTKYKIILGNKDNSESYLITAEEIGLEEELD